MEPVEALRVVYDLAQANAMDEKEAEVMDMMDEYERQENALDIVYIMLQDGILNLKGEDG